MSNSLVIRVSLVSIALLGFAYMSSGASPSAQAAEATAACPPSTPGIGVTMEATEPALNGTPELSDRQTPEATLEASSGAGMNLVHEPCDDHGGNPQGTEVAHNGKGKSQGSDDQPKATQPAGDNHGGQATGTSGDDGNHAPSGNHSGSGNGGQSGDDSGHGGKGGGKDH